MLAGISRGLSSRVEVYAFHDGAPWIGMGASSELVTVVESASDLHKRLDDAAREMSTVVCVVKPWATSADWVKRWLRRTPHAVFRWFDEDDFDEGIHGAWVKRQPLWRKPVVLVRSPMTAWRIRRRLAWWARNADLVTVSSEALASRLGLSGRAVVIPHARPTSVFVPPTPSPRLRIGFLGTPVAYKGVAVLARVLALLSDAELHVFAHTAPDFKLSGSLGDRLVLHDGQLADAVPRALQEVDVVVLPQDPEDEGAMYQLPAKMMDALSHGRPVVVTRTPATAEFAWPGVSFVDDWSDDAQILRAVDQLGDPGERVRLGRGLAERFADECSTEALGAILEGVRPSVCEAELTCGWVSRGIGLRSGS